MCVCVCVLYIYIYRYTEISIYVRVYISIYRLQSRKIYDEAFKAGVFSEGSHYRVGSRALACKKLVVWGFEAVLQGAKQTRKSGSALRLPTQGISQGPTSFKSSLILRLEFQKNHGHRVRTHKKQDASYTDPKKEPQIIGNSQMPLVRHQKLLE